MLQLSLLTRAAVVSLDACLVLIVGTAATDSAAAVKWLVSRQAPAAATVIDLDFRLPPAAVIDIDVRLAPAPSRKC